MLILLLPEQGAIAVSAVPADSTAGHDVLVQPVSLRSFVCVGSFPEQIAGVVVGRCNSEAVLVTLEASVPLSLHVKTILMRGKLVRGVSRCATKRLTHVGRIFAKPD